MLRYLHVYINSVAIEVADYEEHLIILLPEEGILLAVVEMSRPRVDIHKVVEGSVNGFLLACYLQHFLVGVVDVFFCVGEFALVSTAQSVDAPVVEDGGAVRFSIFKE